jgi:inosose dehydratase
MQVHVANAPISYGAFELTVGIDKNVPDGEQVLDEVRDAGYSGIDLGPVGYLGDGPTLARRLEARGLGLAGAYLEFPFPDDERLTKVLPELDAMLATFDAVFGKVPGPAPRPTIADAGSEARRASPARAHADRSVGYSPTQWAAFGEGLRRVVERCRERGYEPTFHHETGTYVEAPWEIEMVLGLSDVGLCLDTGHLFISGGDPVAALRKWGTRVNHVHVKDARRDVMNRIVAEGKPTESIWSDEAFCRLGDGDADVEGVLRELRHLDFDGWLVVEQDIMPKTEERFANAAGDQRANRRYLSERGF